MVAAAESKRQPEPQTSSIESVEVVTADAAPGRTLDDNMTSKTSIQTRESESMKLHDNSKATVNGDAGTFSPPDFRFLNVNFTRASTDQPPNAVASEAKPAVVMEPEDVVAAEAATTSEPATAVSEPSVAAAALSPLPEINEGDTFFALATFVSETGEAMNLVEGEKV